MQEIKAYQAGVGDLRSRTLYPPPPAGEIRAQLNLSQAAFAGLMGVSLRTLQDWEQGSRPARRVCCYELHSSIQRYFLIWCKYHNQPWL